MACIVGRKWKCFVEKVLAEPKRTHMRQLKADVGAGALICIYFYV